MGSIPGAPPAGIAVTLPSGGCKTLGQTPLPLITADRVPRGWLCGPARQSARVLKLFQLKSHPDTGRGGTAAGDLKHRAPPPLGSRSGDIRGSGFGPDQPRSGIARTMWRLYATGGPFRRGSLICAMFVEQNHCRKSKFTGETIIVG